MGLHTKLERFDVLFVGGPSVSKLWSQIIADVRDAMRFHPVMSLGEVLDIADRITVIRRGKVVADGPAKSLIDDRRIEVASGNSLGR
jgi:ABC-type branched-subunit amino acid transport system ATPase component